TGVQLPALIVSTSDSGLPVGPGSDVHYTVTVRNVGNAAATGVTIRAPLPGQTSFVSAGSGGTFGGGAVRWDSLTVPAGGSTSVDFTARISPNLPGSVTSIVNDGIVVKSDQGVDATGSPHTVPIAPPHAVTVSSAEQKGVARVGTDASYSVHVTNLGFRPDSYALTTTYTWPAATFDASCGTPLSTTPTVAPGSSVDVCVKVSVPAA